MFVTISEVEEREKNYCNNIHLYFNLIHCS
jgi:hypothetical protein